jgi:hypothetical protein
MRTRIAGLALASFIAASPYLHGQELYQPPNQARFGSATLTVAYPDAAGLNRTLKVQIRLPLDGSGAALPLVLWSHDGDPVSESTGVLTAWSDWTASIGYLTVTVAHAPRDEAQQKALCSTLEISEELCPSYPYRHWDRAQDLQRILSALEQYNQSGPAEVRGRIDLDRITVAGTGDGAGAVFSTAGATRLMTPSATRARPNTFPSPVPAAFIAISPLGPDQAGFYDMDTNQPTQSWSGLRRPVLSITGAGDSTCIPEGTCPFGDSPSMRLIPYQYMPAGGKYQMYLESVLTSHEFLSSLDVAQCEEEGVDKSHCEAHAGYLKSTVAAFLDGVVRKLEPARDWLANGVIGPASNGMVSWRSK